MLKEMRKVTSRNRTHRWRISSLRPRRTPRSLFHLPYTPARSRPPKTQSYVWLHVSLKNSSRVRKMSIVMIFESKKWTSAAGARGEGGETVREGPISRLGADPFSVPFPSITPSPSLHQYTMLTRMRTIRTPPSCTRVHALLHSYACSCMCVCVLNNA